MYDINMFSKKKISWARRERYVLRLCLLDEEVLGVYILSASMNDPLIQIRQTASQDDANTSTASTTSIIEVTSPSEETECDTDDANVCIIHINIFKM